MGEPGLALRFKVTIDGFIPLGVWTKIEGLAMEYDIKEYAEGGQNGFVHKIPGRVKYPNIKLTRPIDDTSSMVSLWMTLVGIANIKGTANITVLNSAGDEVASYDLMGVWPAKWTGPSLDVFGNQIATESLELAHEGFFSLLGLAAGAAGALGGAVAGSVSISGGVSL